MDRLKNEIMPKPKSDDSKPKSDDSKPTTKRRRRKLRR